MRVLCVKDASRPSPMLCCGGAAVPQVLDCNDQCPHNATLTVDADDDNDSVVNCVDECRHDPGKSEPGVCGCGTPDSGVNTGDSDSDGTLNCYDECPLDAAKIVLGVCGCGVPDTDADGDGLAGCEGTLDECDADPQKTERGWCGCGVADIDSDGDRFMDCLDECPDDPEKQEEGECGCGRPETSCGVRAALVVVGHVDTSDGAPTLVAGVNCSQLGQGGRDAFAAVVDPASGLLHSVACAGSSGDEVWTCAASNAVGPRGNSPDRQLPRLVVLGGHTTGRPTSLGLDTGTGAAAREALVAAYADADAMVNGSAAMPLWAVAWGHATDEVDASVLSVAVQPASIFAPRTLVIAVGSYTGGRLNVPLGASDVTLDTPSGTGVFMAGVAGDAGSAAWVVPLGDGGGSSSVAAGGMAAAWESQQAVVCVNRLGDHADVTAVRTSNGEVLWTTRVHPWACEGVAVAPGGGALRRVVAVGTSQRRDLSLGSSVTVNGVARHNLDAGTRPVALVLELDLVSGEWLRSEAINVPGASETTASSVTVDPATGDALVAGSLITASQPSGLVARVAPPVSVGAGAPSVLYRQGTRGEEHAVDLAVLPTAMAVVGSVRSYGGARATVGGKGVPDDGGWTSGSLHFVSRHGSRPFGAVVLGTAWGVWGDAELVAVRQVSDTLVVVAGHIGGTNDGCVSAGARGACWIAT